jgi:uncharacterized integral membrane protein (TIGR00698 family)
VTGPGAGGPAAGEGAKARSPGASSAVAGLGVAAVVAAAAEAAARTVVPQAPAVVLALALGAIVGNALATPARKALAPGLDVVKKRILRAAIIIYGLGITAGNLRAAGLPVLGLVAICLVVSLAISAVAGRAFGTSPRVRLLLGCGTAICGATAVVTIAPLVDADDDEVAFAVATIFLFNLVALLAFPPIGHRLALSDTAFGAWCGTAVNDTSAVVATGRAFSGDAGAFATLVKVIRTLALVPMALVVGAAAARRRGAEAGAARVSIASVFPWFVLGFAATAAVAATGRLPAAVAGGAKQVAGVLVTCVLAAVGLHLDARKVAGAGARSLGLGFAIAGVMAVVSIALVKVLGIE